MDRMLPMDNAHRPLTFKDITITNDGKIKIVQKPLRPTYKPKTILPTYNDGPFSPEDVLFFQRPGTQHREMDRLRTGYYAIEAELDLHGKTKESAFNLFTHFIKNCLLHQYRCVRIIHGKGREKLAIIKTEVNAWLQTTAAVQAFCSAPANAGGTGAVIILLKRSNP